MLPTQKEVVAHIRDTVRTQVAWATTRFDVNLNNLRLVIKSRDCARIALGGRKGNAPYLQFNIFHLLSYPVQGVLEYKSFRFDRRVGGFATTDWRLWVDSVVAHEMAHAVQYAIKDSGSRLDLGNGRFEGLGKFEANHGDFFLAIYRVLREQFINHRATGIGSFRGGDHFERKEAQLAKLAAKRVDTFPLQGRMVRIGGTQLKLVQFDVKARKYAYIAETAQGKKYKLSKEQVLRGLVPETALKMAA